MSDTTLESNTMQEAELGDFELDIRIASVSEAGDANLATWSYWDCTIISGCCTGWC